MAQYQDIVDEESTLGSQSFEGDATYTQFRIPRIVTAGDELEALCRTEIESGDGGGGGGGTRFIGFPQKVLAIVKMLGGNHCCVDCGDEESENLRFGSVGYGTIMCQECAHRHMTNAEQESIIKSFYEDQWSLRSVISLLEGSNSRMLEFIKNKPRWRASKSSRNMMADSDDVLAFKQIYLSKATAHYRKLLEKKVEEVYEQRVAAQKREDAAQESIALAVYGERVTPGPFDHIFETTQISPDDIPGFHSSVAGIDSSISSRTKNVSMPPMKRGSRSVSGSILGQKEAPSLEAIKERINMRRSFMPSQMQQTMPTDAMGSNEGMGVHNMFQEAPPSIRIPANDMEPQGPDESYNMPDDRRRVSNIGSRQMRRFSSGMELVGEVGGYSIQDQHPDDDHRDYRRRPDDVSSVGYSVGVPTMGGASQVQRFGKIGGDNYDDRTAITFNTMGGASQSQRFGRIGEDNYDDRTAITFNTYTTFNSARNSASAAPLGTYRRVNSSSDFNDAGNGMQRPMYRPPSS